MMLVGWSCVRADLFVGETPQGKMWVSGDNFLGEMSRLVDERPHVALF